MWKTIKPFLKKLLGSRKAWATGASVTVTILAYAGVVVPVDAVLPIVASLSTFVMGLAFNEWGKDAKQIEFDAKKEE